MPTSPNDSPQTDWHPSPVSAAQQNSVGEDEQLTIKIPNPKVFMARQSQWVGRRGKPRCDSCRQDNLKCDRQRPACNHCSWGSGKECKYTPLPTPAHRGIPRCDRCRLENLKCDRNLPICNFCIGSGDGPCNYTPKRRQKTSAGDEGVERAGEDSDEAQGMEDYSFRTESAASHDRDIPSSSRKHGKHPFLIPSNTVKGLLSERSGPKTQTATHEIAGISKQLPPFGRTPTHRGIPRCDQCRSKNLKCDRGLPICNNCTEGKGCSYSPKGHYKTPASDQKIEKIEEDSDEAQEVPEEKRLRQAEGTVYHEQPTPSTSHNTHGKDYVSLPFNWEDSPHQYAPLIGSKIYDMYDTHRGMPPLPPVEPMPPMVAARSSNPIRHASDSRRLSSVPSAYVEPWYNPHFAPIPEYVVRSLRVISRAMVPSRNEFDDALLVFQQNMMIELRETVCFPPAVYATMSVALKDWGSDSSEISDYIVRWVNIHWVGSGSAKFYLILTPRLSDNPKSRSEMEDLRSQFIECYDKKWFTWTKTFPAILQDLSPDNEEYMTHFNRVPVQPQIYDLLTYAHRTHGNASEMLAEIRHIGYSSITWPMAEIYIGMCPVCGPH